MRNELTDGKRGRGGKGGRLASVLNTALLIVMLGLLDRSAWWLAAEGQQQRVSYGAVLLVAAAALRGVLPMLLSHRQELPGIGKTVMLTLASLLGLVLAFCLAAWWIGVVYAAVLLPVFTPAGLDFMRGWAWLGTIAVIIGRLRAGDRAQLRLSQCLVAAHVLQGADRARLPGRRQCAAARRAADRQGVRAGAAAGAGGRGRPA